MGESKRRKSILKDEYGYEIPQDYKKKPFTKQPCFGYWYRKQFKDEKPAKFTVAKELCMVLNQGKFVYLIFTIKGKGMVTVEVDDPVLKPKFKEFLANNNVFHFTAKPNSAKRYLDKNGLKVIPFEIISLCDDNNNVKRNFVVIPENGGSSAVSL